MTKNEVLQLLSKNIEYVSGEYISKQLGVSRVSVNKAVSALKREGYVIDSVTNKGYMLLSKPDRISEMEIKPLLKTETIGKDVLYFDTIDSTNNYVKNNYDRLSDGTVVISDSQTKGRGRLGRSFVSDKGVGIYLSVLIKPEIIDHISSLTAMTAVCLCNAIEEVTGVRPSIKWTNDIIMNNKKACGILTEMGVEGETGKIQYVVIGIGINVNQNEEDFPKELKDIAGSIKMGCGKNTNRASLCACLLNELDTMYSDLYSNQSLYLDKYKNDCLNIGKRILVMKTKEGIEAQALGINEDFSLLVRYSDGTIESIKSGEVSIRGLMGYS